jgi:hypothetical protein
LTVEVISTFSFDYEEQQFVDESAHQTAIRMVAGNPLSVPTEQNDTWAANTVQGILARA